MKVEVHENTGLVYLTSQDASELYLLGRIAAKMSASSDYPVNDGTSNRRITIKLDDVLKKLGA